MNLNEAKKSGAASGSAPWMSGDNKPGASGGGKLPKGTKDKKMVSGKPSGPNTDVAKVTTSRKGRK